VVATVQVLPGRADALIEKFAGVIEGTHLEPGCLTYSLHRDKAQANRLVIVERWRSQEDLDAHFGRPHMAAMAELAESLAAPPEVVFCEPIPLGDPAKNFASG
jgi:quinol monooxygenase YgiN